YAAYRDLVDSDRWQRLANRGARAQRLLFASTGTKDPKASDVLYVDALAGPNTVNTMPQATLKATADHSAAANVLPRDGGDAGTTLALFEKAGVNITALAEKLQGEGADAFVQSWRDLLQAIAAKSKALS
ncbi:MAG: transaldolase, partial [Hyphomicrobiales bacterium]|nr:transaldolase [Hyphomicrobiales bacterium]